MFAIVINIDYFLRASPNHAEGPPPHNGTWIVQDVKLVVDAKSGGTCGLSESGKFTTLGPCFWQPSSRRAGILFINSKSGPTVCDVMWIDSNTISISGEVFQRQ